MVFHVDVNLTAPGLWNPAGHGAGKEGAVPRAVVDAEPILPHQKAAEELRVHPRTRDSSAAFLRLLGRPPPPTRLPGCQGTGF